MHPPHCCPSGAQQKKTIFPSPAGIGIIKWFPPPFRWTANAVVIRPALSIIRIRRGVHPGRPAGAAGAGPAVARGRRGWRADGGEIKTSLVWILVWFGLVQVFVSVSGDQGDGLSRCPGFRSVDIESLSLGLSTVADPRPHPCGARVRC